MVREDGECGAREVVKGDEELGGVEPAGVVWGVAVV